MRVTKLSNGNTVVYHYDKEGRLLSEDGGNGSKIADYIYLNAKLAAKVVNTFTVSATAGANGSLDASTPSPQTVNYGGTATFTFNANTGYHVASVSGCGGTSYVNSDNLVISYTYTTGPITADCSSVSATFAINQYTVTLSAGTGGYFNPATLPLINYNSATSSTAFPNSGYHITFVSGCGGTPVGPQATNASKLYNTGLITADCTVSATFSNTFTVTASAGANGVLDITYRTSPQIVTYNGTTSFKFNAATGYHVVSVSGCNGTPYNNTSNGISTYTYTTGAITDDCTVQAAFSINQYQVSASAGVNGSLDASTPSPKTINHGGSTAFKFVAATGYHVSGISGCWGTPYTNTSNTVTMYTYSTGSIVGDCTVQATFAINEYQVTATAGQNGSLSASTPTPQTISYNGTTSFTFDSNTDYHIGTIEGCWGTPYANTAPAVTSYSYSTGPITADCTVTTTFVINPPVASFTFVTAPASGKAPLRAEFTDTSTPPASQWDWDFGDGSPHSHEQNPVHVYEGPGTFTVTLTATNAGGTSDPTATHDIPVAICDKLDRTVRLSSSPDPFTTIPAALSAASPGDAIQSQALHFPENVTVDKDITLDGGYDCDMQEKVGNSTIQGPTDPSLSIDTGSATIDGISVE
ncbi:MAG: PKD domain-containing protein [Nitrospiraceae bacterium]|nr:PKD domain-containing protein [Nitrospiraceae bacterium]